MSLVRVKPEDVRVGDVLHDDARALRRHQGVRVMRVNVYPFSAPNPQGDSQYVAIALDNHRAAYLRPGVGTVLVDREVSS